MSGVAQQTPQQPPQRSLPGFTVWTANADTHMQNNLSRVVASSQGR